MRPGGGGIRQGQNQAPPQLMRTHGQIGLCLTTNLGFGSVEFYVLVNHGFPGVCE